MTPLLVLESEFTDRARMVIQLALQEAHRLGLKTITTDHILLALAKEGRSVAARILQSHGLDIGTIRRESEAAFAYDPATIQKEFYATYSDGPIVVDGASK